MSATGHKWTHAPQQPVSLIRPITICQHAAKAIPLISGTDRAETLGRIAPTAMELVLLGRLFWRMPQPVLRSVAFPSEGPSIRE
jgi:hypothetical protein